MCEAVFGRGADIGWAVVRRSYQGEDEMTDRELLEFAAKAAGIEPDWYERGIAINHGNGKDDYHNDAWVDIWNPLNDDSDAFRLAVKLSLNVNIYNLVVSYENADEYIEKHFPEGVIYDVAEATRRAIVRVAAEVGREK